MKLANLTRGVMVAAIVAGFLTGMLAPKSAAVSVPLRWSSGRAAGAR